MAWFGGASVKTKLTLASILGSGAALLVVGVVITSLDLMALRQRLVRRMSIQADIVGANGQSALLFNDPKSAETTLAALRADPRIRAAGLYAADRRLFATYLRDPADKAILLPDVLVEAGQGHRLRDDRLLMVRSILFEGKEIGMSVIVSDLSEISATLTRDIGVFASVLVVSLLLALGISTWLQREISEPILRLAATARKVTVEKDYAVRASGGGQDDIGTLVAAFNEMLDEIGQQQSELRGARDRMEQRVTERTAQLQAANKELEAFSYSVSHDLRAPLRSIEGFSRALMEDCEEGLGQSGRDSLQRIVRSTVKMAQLIDGLLNLSRVSRAEIRGRSVDLSSLAGEVVSELKEGEGDRAVECVIAAGAIAEGDPALLRAVLQNLIGNAWKFTRKVEPARIEFGFGEDGSGRTYFVRDNGAGFDMSYADKLFGAFQRLHGQTEFPGIGIGLATVQRIVNRHGGRVWAVGAIDKGATVYFTLGTEGGHRG